MIEGVGAGKNDLTLTVWLYGVGEKDHGLGVGGQARISVIEEPVWVDPQATQPDIPVLQSQVSDRFWGYKAC